MTGAGAPLTDCRKRGHADCSGYRQNVGRIWSIIFLTNPSGWDAKPGRDVINDWELSTRGIARCRW
ncbi:MAG: hypothetical protein ACRD1H_18805, partial [Vicinamibacterales bacterium]